MRKLNSAEKHLYELRGRVLHRLLQAEEVEAGARAAAAAAALRTAETRERLARLDEAIRGRGVDPTRIEPIAATKGRYGKRGRLKEAILRTLADVFPERLSSEALGAHVMSECGLILEDRSAESRWRANSLWPQLMRFVRQGVVEREQYGNSASMAFWCLRVERQPTLAELAAQAASLQSPAPHASP